MTSLWNKKHTNKLYLDKINYKNIKQFINEMTNVDLCAEVEKCIVLTFEGLKYIEEGEEICLSDVKKVNILFSGDKQLIDATKRYYLKMYRTKDIASLEDFYTRLKGCKGLQIPNIKTMGKFETFFFIVEEAILGDSLGEYINNNTISADVFFDISKKICRELSKYQDLSLAHVDLKPDNILIDRTNSIFFVDFEAAFFKDQNQRDLQGTKPYLAPEMYQEDNDFDSKKIDVFSFGWIMEDMYKRCSYYNQQRLSRKYIQLIIDKCKSENYKNRYYADELQKELKQVEYCYIIEKTIDDYKIHNVLSPLQGGDDEIEKYKKRLRRDDILLIIKDDNEYVFLKSGIFIRKNPSFRQSDFEAIDFSNIFGVSFKERSIIKLDENDEITVEKIHCLNCKYNALIKNIVNNIICIRDNITEEELNNKYYDFFEAIYKKLDRNTMSTAERTEAWIKLIILGDQITDENILDVINEKLGEIYYLRSMYYHNEHKSRKAHVNLNASKKLGYKKSEEINARTILNMRDLKNTISSFFDKK